MRLASGTIPPGTTRLTRLAGALYLIIILCGVWSEGVVRAGLIHPGDAAATARALHGAAGLFRLSIAADTVMALADAALAVLFWHLLAPAGPLLAAGAAAFRLLQAAVIGASLVILAGVPRLLPDGDAGLIAQLVAMHGTGYDIGLIFFGVNSLLMALLLVRAGGVPRLICAGVAASGLVYLTGSYLRLLAPGWHAGFQPAYLLPLVSESALCLWLLIAARLWRGPRTAG